MARKVFLFLVILCLSGLTTLAQKPDVKHTTAPPTAINGQEMYASYCASCHGRDGTGNGPVAQTIKTPMPDLTTLARRNGGKFPALAVENSITGDPDMPAAHGTADMPVWGPVLSRLSHESHADLHMRLAVLVEHVQSLQK